MLNMEGDDAICFKSCEMWMEMSPPPEMKYPLTNGDEMILVFGVIQCMITFLVAAF
jgi:hypothetical protein